MEIERHRTAEFSRAGRLGPDPEPLGARFEVLMRREFPPKRHRHAPRVAENGELDGSYLVRGVLVREVALPA